MRRWFRQPSVLSALAAVASHAVSVRLKLFSDELDPVHKAALSLADASRLLEPWTGGATLRIPPKLALMGGVLVLGPRATALHTLLVLLHGLNAAYVARLSERLSGSRALGLGTGLLFAIGFGAYGKAVFKTSNITMVLALLFLLLSIDFLLSRRWLLSSAFIALSVLSHEITLGAVVLFPVILMLERRRESAIPGTTDAPSRARAVCAGVAGALGAALLLGALPLALSHIFRLELEMGWFVLFPFNKGAVAAVGGPGWLSAIEDVLVTGRFWLGGAMAVLLGYLVLRWGAFTAVGVTWLYAFLIPAVVFTAYWEESWMERRYIYVASVGACMVAANIVLRLRGRSRLLGAVAAGVLVAWSLGLVGMMWHKSVIDSHSPLQVRHRQEYLRELGRLNPRWKEIAERERSRG